MKILIINIDSTIQNYALEKIAKFHQDRGDEIVWDLPLAVDTANKIYVSCIFDWNKEKCKQWQGRALIGGSGYDMAVKLPEEIEEIKPKINMGFTTRGCIRKCKFCIVPKKEGRIRIEGDLLDLWDGQAKEIKLLDNNILALPKHFDFICSQAKKHKISLDFNQGLDHRLLTHEICYMINTISHKKLNFAWDNVEDFQSVKKALWLLRKNKIFHCNWYILTGFNTTFEQDLFRVNYLRDMNQSAYVMRYNGTEDRQLKQLARWVNNHAWFRGITWPDFKIRNEKYMQEKEKKHE